MKCKELLRKSDFIVFVASNLKMYRKSEERQYMRAIIKQVAHLKGKSRFSVRFDMFVKCLCSSACFTDYYLLNFYNMTLRETTYYLSGARWSKLHHYLKSPEARSILNDKARFLAAFREFTKRDFFYITDAATTEELEEFIRKHSSFIAKPNRLNSGRGVELVDTQSFPDTETLLSYLRKNQTVLLEERIMNHVSLAKYSDRSLNTMRIVSVRTEDGVKLICAFLKFNTKGGIVDNLSAGGYACPIDIQTGNLVRGMTGIKELTNIFLPRHPKGFLFEGESIPFWSETVDMVIKAMDALNEAFYVAWDVAVTDDGPVIVEGNNNPGHIIQAISGVPIYKDIKKASKYARKCLRRMV